MNAEKGLNSGVKTTSVDGLDGHKFCSKATDRDLYSGKGYDNGENHFYLELYRLQLVVRLK